MKGYLIFTEQIIDQAVYDEYVSAVMPTIEKYNGHVLIVQDDPTVLEGSWHGSRTVVLEFDSPDVAIGWYHSPEYQAIIGKRHTSTQTNVIIVNEFVLT